MNKLKLGALLIGLLAVTHYTAWWYGSQKPAEIKIVEKEVIKKDVVTQIVEIVKPDGTKETKTVIVDKSTENSIKELIQSVRPRDWLVGAYYKVNDPAYGISVNRRVFGPVFVSVSADTQRQLSVGLGMEF